MRGKSGPAILAAVLIASSGIAAQQRPLPPRPPLPRDPYDPTPGPFIVGVDDDGHIKPGGDGIIANALANWQGDRLQAFRVCSGSAQSGDWNKFAGLRSVAAALKQHGARTVVSLDGGRCDPATAPRSQSGRYVEVMGVVEL